MLVTMSDKELLRASVIQAVVEKRPLLAHSGLTFYQLLTLW